MKSTIKMMGDIGKKNTGFTSDDGRKELQGSRQKYRDKSLQNFQDR